MLNQPQERPATLDKVLAAILGDYYENFGSPNTRMAKIAAKLYNTADMNSKVLKL
jgi:hypothetical protein